VVERGKSLGEFADQIIIRAGADVFLNILGNCASEPLARVEDSLCPAKVPLGMRRVSLAGDPTASLPEIQHVILAVDLGYRQHQLTEPIRVEDNVVLTEETVVILAVPQRAHRVDVAVAA